MTNDTDIEMATCWQSASDELLPEGFAAAPLHLLEHTFLIAG